jgi:putative PIN family toxin of toxin-antitoxin system
LGLVRVVLDTNVLISACLKPDGLEARVAAMAASGEIEACVTDEVFAEYRDVLRRDKFRAWRDAAETLLDAFTKRTRAVTAGAPVQAAGDEDDNRFLECAAAAGAEYLITGNLRHYPPQWGCTRIVNARGFLERTAPHYLDDNTN